MDSAGRALQASEPAWMTKERETAWAGFGIAICTIILLSPLFIYLWALLYTRSPPKVAPAPTLTEEEAALLRKLQDIVERICGLAEGATLVSLAEWRPQLETALEEVRAAPASDGLEESFESRKALEPHLKPLVATIEADLVGCQGIEAVAALDDVIAFDRDGDGDFDENDIAVNTIDLSAIYALEQVVKATKGLKGPSALFVADAETLLEKRRIERDLVSVHMSASHEPTSTDPPSLCDKCPPPPAHSSLSDRGYQGAQRRRPASGALRDRRASEGRQAIWDRQGARAARAASAEEARSRGPP
jgi:hypothetical protein